MSLLGPHDYSLRPAQTRHTSALVAGGIASSTHKCRQAAEAGLPPARGAAMSFRRARRAHDVLNKLIPSAGRWAISPPPPPLQHMHAPQQRSASCSHAVAQHVVACTGHQGSTGLAPRHSAHLPFRANQQQRRCWVGCQTQPLPLHVAFARRIRRIQVAQLPAATACRHDWLPSGGEKSSLGMVHIMAAIAPEAVPAANFRRATAIHTAPAGRICFKRRAQTRGRGLVAWMRRQRRCAGSKNSNWF